MALALAVRAAPAVVLTRRRGRVIRGAVALGLGLLVAADYHPWRPTGISGLRPGGPEFATVRAEGPRALWIPLLARGTAPTPALYLYATTLTRVPMLNGYSAWLDRSFLPDVYRPLENVNLGVVGESEARTLLPIRRAPDHLGPGRPSR